MRFLFFRILVWGGEKLTFVFSRAPSFLLHLLSSREIVLSLQISISLTRKRRSRPLNHSSFFLHSEEEEAKKEPGRVCPRKSISFPFRFSRFFCVLVNRFSFP